MRSLFSEMKKAKNGKLHNHPTDKPLDPKTAG